MKLPLWAIGTADRKLMALTDETGTGIIPLFSTPLKAEKYRNKFKRSGLVVLALDEARSAIGLLECVLLTDVEVEGIVVNPKAGAKVLGMWDAIESLKLKYLAKGGNKKGRKARRPRNRRQKPAPPANPD